MKPATTYTKHTALESAKTLQEIRDITSSRFEELSWPTTELEAWRRTDLKKVPLDTYGPRNSTDQNEKPQAESDITKEALNSDSFHEVIKFSGDTVADRSGESEFSVETFSISDSTSLPEGFAKGAAKAYSQTIDRVQVWHYASLSHGVRIHLAKNKQYNHPLLILFEESGEKVVSAPHVSIHAESGAEAEIVILVINKDDDDVIVNAGIDAQIEANASVKVTMVQELGINSRFFAKSIAEVERDGRFLMVDGQLGASLVKTTTGARLIGSGAHVDLDGFYFALDRQHMDIQTLQHHGAANTTSDAFYKGAVRDSARTVYRGLITVTEDGVKTDAYLSNKNLVLNSGARADSIPTLNIETNDVKCSHGSTTGKIDPEQVFYLQSRGFNTTEAKKMLTTGFFEQIVSKIPESFRESVRGAIADRI